MKTKIIIPKNTCIFCLQIRIRKIIDEDYCEKMERHNLCFSKMQDDKEVIKRLEEIKK